MIGLHHYEPRKRIFSASATHADGNHSILKFSFVGADLSDSQLSSPPIIILFIGTVLSLNFGVLLDTHL